MLGGEIMVDATLQFLNNASVAAFLGAFSALLLVVLNDWRRRRRSKTQLRYLVGDNLEHARVKLRSVQNHLGLLAENRVAPAPIMPFPVGAIQSKQLDVIDMLGSNENRALDALLYWMDAIDGLLEDFRLRATELQRAIETNGDHATQNFLLGQVKTNLADAKRNIEILIGLCELYVEGKYHQILELQHPIERAAS